MSACDRVDDVICMCAMWDLPIAKQAEVQDPRHEQEDRSYNGKTVFRRSTLKICVYLEMIPIVDHLLLITQGFSLFALRNDVMFGRYQAEEDPNGDIDSLATLGRSVAESALSGEIVRAVIAYARGGQTFHTKDHI